MNKKVTETEAYRAYRSKFFKAVAIEALMLVFYAVMLIWRDQGKASPGQYAVSIGLMVLLAGVGTAWLYYVGLKTMRNKLETNTYTTEKKVANTVAHYIIALVVGVGLSLLVAFEFQVVPGIALSIILLVWLVIISVLVLLRSRQTPAERSEHVAH